MLVKVLWQLEHKNILRVATGGQHLAVLCGIKNPLWLLVLIRGGAKM